MPWLEDLKFPRGYQMGTHNFLLMKYSYFVIFLIYNCKRFTYNRNISEDQFMVRQFGAVDLVG